MALSLRRRAEDYFSTIARYWSWEMGRARSFVAACLVVGIWLICGPIFGWSDTWQLIINTATTILTWLAVFLVQNTQTRDTLELNLKLNELIRVSEKAHNRMMLLEKLNERQLMEVKVELELLAGDMDT